MLYWLNLSAVCFTVSFYALNALSASGSKNIPEHHAEINKENPSYNNKTGLSTESGVDVWVNGWEGFSGSLTNEGNLTVTGAGYGIYESAYPTRAVQFSLTNKGTIQRIQLEQIDNKNTDWGQNGTTDWQSLRPGSIDSVVMDVHTTPYLIQNTAEGIIQGQAGFGVNTTVLNEGKFENFDLDNSDTEKGNLLSMGYNSRFLNGIDWLFKYGETGEPEGLQDIKFSPTASLTTDKVQFAYQGMLINAGIINNKSITFGDLGYLYNVGNAYNEANIGGLLENGADIITQKLVMGEKSLLINEMGTNFTADSLQTGDGSLVMLGSDYSLYIPQTQQITVTDSEGNETTAEEVIPPFPHQAQMNVKNAVLGNNSSFIVQNGSLYTGETLEFKNNGIFTMQSGTVTVDKPDGSGLLLFGDNAQINIDGIVQEVPTSDVSDSEDSPDNEEESDDSLDKGPVVYTTYSKLLDASLTADTFKTGSGGLISIGTAKACIQEEGNERCANVNIHVGQGIFGDGTNMVLANSANLAAENYLSFGNGSAVQNGAIISSPLITFTDNGVLINNGYINGEKLIMGNSSRIDNYYAITLNTTLGSNSQANLLGGSPQDFNYMRGVADPQFSGGMQKAEGASGVTIVNQTGFDSERGYISGYLTGGVNVDSILVESGELQMSGDVRGVIGINTDAQLRLVDTDVYIHDPISKVTGSANTKLIVDLTGDDHFYKTSNTVNVDHIYLAGGGFEINNPVWANEIKLNSNTTVRLDGNYYTGDIVEMHDDAVNTTLDINANEGKTIYSTGNIKVDRVVVESGTFDVNHAMEATYKSSSSVMPSTNESGIELNSNTVLNVNSNDVNANRIVRDQTALKQGKDVTNTTVSINGGKMAVERNVDVDHLNINGGTFEFQNEDSNNVVNIGESLEVNHGGHIAGTGLMNLRNGALDVNSGGRLSVSTESVYQKPVGVMEIMQSENVYTDADKVADKGSATVNFHAGGILDLRASDKENDKIVVSGTVNLEKDTRVILRDIKPGWEYNLLSATQLNGDMESLRTSFLWKGATFKNTDNTLSLKITGLQTLNEGIASASHSVNVESIAEAMSEINSRTASNTIDPFLDRVFYAYTAEEAIGVMDEYSPEGYLNTQQIGLRTTRMFRQSASDELNDLRTYREAYENRFLKPQAVHNPHYYGRPGYESYYSNWNNRRGTERRNRTDKGGIWAKPFMMSFNQDDNSGISGYEFSNYGLTAGLDKRFGSLSIGVMGLYADGSADQNDKVVKSDIKTYGAGVYGYYRPYKSRQFLNLYALWTQSSNSAEHRTNTLVETAKADFDVTTYSVGADIGVDIPVNLRFIITPKVGIDYAKASLDDIEEKNTSAGKLFVTADDYTSIQTPVEIRALFDLGSDTFRLKPEAHARWTHEFGDTKSTGKGLFVNYNQPFGVESVELDKDTFTLGGSLLWLYAVSEMELKYDYDFSSTGTGHAVNASYKYLF